MCPGVKQGCPDQPLTPGSFIRLCSRHSSIDKGHWRGHRRSLFTSIQLKHQRLNQCLLFIGTLIVFIDWQVVQWSLHWVSHFFFISSLLFVCSDTNSVSLCTISLLLDSIFGHHFGVIFNHPHDFWEIWEARLIIVPLTERHSFRRTKQTNRKTQPGAWFLSWLPYLCFY